MDPTPHVWTAINQQRVQSTQHLWPVIEQWNPSTQHEPVIPHETNLESRRRRGGVLRGLNLNNVLATLKTQPTPEVSNNEVSEVDEPRHATRQSRHGRSAANYDMKLHPMDEVTRPKRAAKRLSGSRSWTLTPLIDDVQADQESLPTSDVDGDSSSATMDEEEDETPVIREQDPLATRRSSRHGTQRPVNYSAKHHPQDFGIPGHQHKARQLARSQRNKQSPRPTGRYRSRSPSPPHDSPEIPDSDDQEDDVILLPPRKKLRLLQDDRPRAEGKGRQSRQSPKKVPPQPGRTVTNPMDISSRGSGEDTPESVQRPESPQPVANPANASGHRLTIGSDHRIEGSQHALEELDCHGALQESLHPENGDVDEDFIRTASQQSLNTDDPYLGLFPQIQRSYQLAQGSDKGGTTTSHVSTSNSRPFRNISSRSRTVVGGPDTTSKPLIDDPDPSPHLAGDFLKSVKRVDSGDSEIQAVEPQSEFEEQMSITQPRDRDDDENEHSKDKVPSVSQLEPSDDLDTFESSDFSVAEGPHRLRVLPAGQEEAVANAECDARAGSAYVSYEGSSDDTAADGEIFVSRRAGGNLLRHFKSA